MGSYDIYPNLYIMFVAPPGRARKTTTTDYAETLIDDIDDITKSPELVTKESLFTTLVNSHDSAMCIRAPEFGEFMAKSGPDMYGFLTNMYDGKKKILGSTLSRGQEFVEKPCINLLGATTPQWIAANMPESVIGGGFARRVIFVYEQKKRRSQLYYRELDQQALEDIRQNLVADLSHIALNLHGEYNLTEEAITLMEGWYKRLEKIAENAPDEMQGYYESKHVLVHKVAILIHVSRSDNNLITKSDFESAIGLLDQQEKKLPHVFTSIGKNPYTFDVKKMREWIAKEGTVDRAALYEKYQNVATPKMLDELIEGMRQAEYIGLKANLETGSTQIIWRKNRSNGQINEDDSQSFDPEQSVHLHQS
jgi:hypothetical protein